MIRFRSSQTGLTDLYARVSDDQGRKWNGAAFETYQVAHCADYSLALAESPAGGYEYTAAFPPAINTAGEYLVEVFQGAGAAADPRRGGPTSLFWDGSAEVTGAEWAAARVRATLIAIPAIAEANAGLIVAYRGDTLAAALTGLGDLTGRTKLWFTVKRRHEDTDAKSVLQIEETDGLLYLNGAEAETPADGSLTVTDEAAGELTVSVTAATAAQLSPGNYSYDFQALDSDGVSTVAIGRFQVVADVTRAVT